jgi:hypothetical protein
MRKVIQFYILGRYLIQAGRAYLLQVIPWFLLSGFANVLHEVYAWALLAPEKTVDGNCSQTRLIQRFLRWEQS